MSHEMSPIPCMECTHPKSVEAWEPPRSGLLAATVAALLLLVACGSEQSSQESFSALGDSSSPVGVAWQPTASLAQARYYHTATLLPNGKVLVVGGGLTDGRVLNQTELYDPATGKWVAAAPLSHSRLGHSATLLPGGKLLVVGGWNGTAYVASTELYDPSKGTWTLTGSLNQERHYHTATVLADGRVLVTGGWNNSFTLASAELYDPATGRWTVTGSLAQARDSHTATLLPDGKVLVVGGWGTTSHLASAELYDPATGSWTAAASLDFARGYHTATKLANGKVLVVGGYDESGLPASTALYNPGTGLWETLRPLGQARYYHTATLLKDGRVVVAGGYGASNTSIASAELYDPGTGVWTATASLAEARSNHAATLLATGRVLVLGGKSSGSEILSSAEVYGNSGDVTPPETRLDSTPAPRTNSTSATFTFSSNEAGATFECSRDGAAFSACTSPTSFQGLSAGSHTFRVRARDAAGNVDATPASYSWSVDLTPPETRLDSTPPVESFLDTATFTFSSSEGSATFECNLDGTEFKACVSPWTRSGLAQGRHTFQVRARDAVGNLDPTPASYTWTILYRAVPAPVIGSPAAGASLSEPLPTFVGTAPPDCLVILTLDGAEVGSTRSNSSGEWRFTPTSPLVEGEHTLVVTASDDSGASASSSSGPLRFTIEFPVEPPPPPADELAGCSAGVGSPSLVLAWLTLLFVASNSRRRASRHDQE